MTFPRRLLIPGEELILDRRPHWIALAIPAVLSVAAIVAAFFIVGSIHSSGWDTAVWIVVLVFLLVYLLPRVVRWLTSNFVVTSDRLIHRQGFIAKRSVEIPLEAINDIRFNQSIFERIIGAGDLILRSAADATPNLFEDVRGPEEIQKTIYHQMEENGKRMYSGRGTPGDAAAAAAPPPPKPSTVTELERLADLRARGILTEDEFQAQKQKILGPPPRTDLDERDRGRDA